MYNHITKGSGLLAFLLTILFTLKWYAGYSDQWLWYGIPVLFLCLALSWGVHWILLRRRGSYDWNVSEITVTIEYKDDDGSEVHVRRYQKMYPNRDGVRSARIGVSPSPEHGYIQLNRNEDWNPKPVPGRSPFGRTPSNCNVSKKWFREARGFYLLIQPRELDSFPYPEFSGLLRPKKYPEKYFSLELEGTVIYKDSYTEDEEYFQLKLNHPGLIDSLRFELILPATWSTCPDVNLFRINTKGFQKIQMTETDGDGKTKRFHAEIKACSDETLRVDWRRTTVRPSG